MNKLTAENLMKIASISERGKNLILHLAKIASDQSSEFNETVPALNTEQLEADKASTESKGNGNAAQQQQQPPVQEEMGQEQYMEGPQQDFPEDIGARAAQSFIGQEIMQAAMSGDPMAQDLIARIAGQIAGAVTESASRSQGQGGIPQGNGMQQEGGLQQGGGIDQGGQQQMAPAISTPEEDLANEIVPPVASPAQMAPAQAPAQDPRKGGEENGDGKKENQAPDNKSGSPAPAPEGSPAPAGDGEKVDVNDVKKLIELAKAGKI